MLAVDSSTLIAFSHNQEGEDIEKLLQALLQEKVVIPPVVLTEVLSNPADNQRIYQVVSNLRELPIQEKYWQRAAFLRQSILKQGLKCRIPDALIAQSCIDAEVPLLTRDIDFRHFTKAGGLKLA